MQMMIQMEMAHVIDDDICPGEDDFIDTDEDSIPDGCDDSPNGSCFLRGVQ